MAKTTKVEKEYRETITAFKRAFSTPSGEKVLNDLKETCSFYTSTNEGGTQRTEKVIHEEGRRSVVLDILALIRADKETIEEYVKSLEPEKGE